MPVERTLRESLIGRLGATVGITKARSAIEASAQALGYTEDSLTAEQVAALLDHLGAGSDIVAIASRLLKTQIVLQSSGGRGGTPAPH